MPRSISKGNKTTANKKTDSIEMINPYPFIQIPYMAGLPDKLSALLQNIKYLRLSIIKIILGNILAIKI